MPHEPSSAELRRWAHEALVLGEPPYLRHYQGSRFEVLDGVTLVASPLPGPGFNYAAALDDISRLPHVERVARDFFGISDGVFGILVEGGAGQPLEADLQAADYLAVEDEPAYVMPAIERVIVPAIAGLETRIVSDADALDDYRAVTAAAFDAPPEMSATFSPASMLGDAGLAMFVGYVDGRAVTASQLTLTARGAAIAGVATVESHRGRGYGAVMTLAAIAEGARRGALYAALRSGPLSRPLYERVGFRYVCQHTTYARPTA